MSYVRKFEYKIVPDNSFPVIHNCAGCSQKKFINTGCFRVNANNKRLDIWLIYQCENCGHTLNIPVYEREEKNAVGSKLQLFLENDRTLAKSYGIDISFFKRNRLQVDLEAVTYHMEKICENVSVVEQTRYQAGDIIFIHNPYKLKIRSEKTAAIILKLSRSRIEKKINSGQIVLRRSIDGLEIELSECYQDDSQ